MKRNLLLLSAVLISVVLVVNSTKKILMFRSTSLKIEDFEARLLKLRQENSDLARELEYKKSNEFAEAEIRNKLGLVKEGERVVIVPKKDEPTDGVESSYAKATEDKPNWRKWRKLFFGS